MTIGQIVSRIKNQVKEHFPNSVLSNRQSWNHFKTASLMFIDRDKMNLYNQDVFAVANIDTEEVNLLESSCVPLDCTVCRFKLPENASTKDGPVYKYIASADLSTQFRLVNPSEFSRKQSIRGNKQKYAFIENNYVYLSSCVPCVRVSYLPEDGIVDTDEDSCSKLDQTAAVPDSILHISITEAVNQLSLFVQKQFDHSSNKDTHS